MASGIDFYADIAQLVEYDLAKVEVAGSSPVVRSNAAVIVLDIVMGEHINPKGLFLTADMKAVQQDFVSFFHN